MASATQGSWEQVSQEIDGKTQRAEAEVLVSTESVIEKVSIASELVRDQAHGGSSVLDRYVYYLQGYVDWGLSHRQMVNQLRWIGVETSETSVRRAIRRHDLVARMPFIISKAREMRQYVYWLCSALPKVAMQLEEGYLDCLGRDERITLCDIKNMIHHLEWADEDLGRIVMELRSFIAGFETIAEEGALD